MKIKDGIAKQEDILPFEYSNKYWDRYVDLLHRPLSVKLNKFRYSLVEHYCKGDILDCGIGSAEFILKCRLKCFGYDINHIAVKWLKDRDLFFDPYKQSMDQICGITMFDVLEHIIDPEELLSKICSGCFLFVSIPIFKNFDNLEQSKHYKPSEHIRYFTELGIIRYIKSFSFKLLEKTDEETKIGREDIMTFVFQKNDSNNI